MNFKEQYLTKNTNIYFISEIGINHNGIFDLAIQMIEKSKARKENHPFHVEKTK